MSEPAFSPAPEGIPLRIGWIELRLLRIPRYQREEPDERVDKLIASM